MVLLVTGRQMVIDCQPKQNGNTAVELGPQRFIPVVIPLMLESLKTKNKRKKEHGNDKG